MRIQCLLRLDLILIGYLVDCLLMINNTTSNKVYCCHIPSGTTVFYLLIDRFLVKECNTLKNFVQVENKSEDGDLT